MESKLYPALSDALMKNGKAPLSVIVCPKDGREDAVRAYREAGFAVLVVKLTQSPETERDREKCATLAASLEKSIENVLAAALERDAGIDAERVAIDGWIAAWAVSHSQRYRAAVQRAALINPSTAFGNCEAGDVCLDEIKGGTLLEKMYSLAESSALAGIDGLKTPLLIDFGKSEPLYSREQSEQLYSAMKDRNADTPCRLVVRGGTDAAAAMWCAKYVDEEAKPEDDRDA